MPNDSSARARRFRAYVERLTPALGHQDRHGPLRDYVTGLCLPGERKSIEPMAARVDPRHVRARHQSMHHFIAKAGWDDAAVLRVARETVLAALERHGPVAAWVVDDTGIPKKGQHSVGVARQYCGVLGKQDTCQVAVSVSVAHARASVPVAYRLYLPEAWVKDRRRRRAAGVPETLEFRPKWQIALEQLTHLRTDGVPAAPVVADAGYGVVTAFRDALTAQGLAYAVGISTETSVWGPGRTPLPAPTYRGVGRPPTLMRRTRRHRPVGGKTRAKHLPASAWRTGTWRQGTRGPALALRRGPRAARPSRRLAIDPTAGGVAAHRVAAVGGRTDQVLALDVAGDGDPRGPGAARDAALADRTGLSRTQRRAGARSLRGPGLAGVSSSRVALHRRVCVSGRGAAGAFPPCAAGLPPPRSSTQGVHATGRSPCVLNDTPPTPSRRCTGSSPGRWRGAGRVSRAVVPRGHDNY